MSLSIIISHYAPKVNCQKYLSLLKDNIRQLRLQNFTKDLEIIVCDDGSFWSRTLFNSIDDKIINLCKEDIKKNPVLKDLDIDVYYGLKDINRYRGVILKDLAIRNSIHNKIVILDDDHHLVNRNSLTKFSEYLDKYLYVKGRVIGPDKIPQLFFSRNAQGTTYGFQKNIYIDSGGFSKYLFNNGYGEDNDILYIFYNYLSRKFNKKVSCFASDISTFDLASNRWLDRSLSLNDFQKEKLASPAESHKIFERHFYDEHGIHYKKRNLSRIRYKWMVIPSFYAFITEIKYTIIYLYYFPKVILKVVKSRI